MSPTIADRLKPDDEVRIVSLATSLAYIPEDQRQTAEELLIRLRVTYSENGEILDRFDSAPVEARVSHLRAASRDPNVRGRSPL